VLLLSDLNERTRASAGKWKFAILQLNNLLDVEETEEGVLQG